MLSVGSLILIDAHTCTFAQTFYAFIVKLGGSIVG